jgi:hypothetical protein
MKEMKFTKGYLKQVIKEELYKLTEESEPVPHEVNRIVKRGEEYLGKYETENNNVYVFRAGSKVITYIQSKRNKHEVGRNDRHPITATDSSTGEDIINALRKREADYYLPSTVDTSDLSPKGKHMWRHRG